MMPKPSGFTYERRRAMRELGRILEKGNERAVVQALVDDLRASFGGPVREPETQKPSKPKGSKP